MVGSELIRHRGVFRKFVEWGNAKFLEDLNTLCVKYVLYNGDELEELTIEIVMEYLTIL